MASSITKRQQARNERSLQHLIRSVPGNDRCADCAAKNPGWASWNLGVFLCMRCAALHRKLGTHVSKVKSLSMDSWTADQVDNMKKLGNAASNKTYNPHNVQPEIPLDADEVDCAIERHIRQKYDQRTLSAGRAATRQVVQNTGSTATSTATSTGTGTGAGSWNDEAPDLPPKPAKRFAFALRSSSAAVPKRQDRITPPLSPAYSGSEPCHEPPSPKGVSKPSRLFGMKITTIDNNFNQKLAYLRDLGFGDNSKNTTVLKGTGANVEKAVEILVRLGEGSKPVSPSVTPAPRALTPVSMGSSGANAVAVDKKKDTNPWEIRASANPPIPARAASVPPQGTASESWNPFLQPPAPPQQPPSDTHLGLENHLHHLHLSQPHQPYGPVAQQPAFPLNGGVQQANNPFFHHQLHQAPPQGSTYPPAGQQWQQSAPPPPLQPSNPWVPPSSQQSLTPSNPWAPQQPQQPQTHAFAGNPWQQQGLSQQQPGASPQPIYGQQTDFFSPPQPSASNPWAEQQPRQSTAPNPWQLQAPPPSQPAQQPHVSSKVWQHQQQPGSVNLAQQYGQQGPGVRHDTSSILSLYNQAQPAPQRPWQTRAADGILQLQQQLQQQQQQQQQQQPQPSSEQMPPHGSATMPVGVMGGGHTNPFGAPPQQPGHGSRDGMQFQGCPGHGSRDGMQFQGCPGHGSRDGMQFQGCPGHASRDSMQFQGCAGDGRHSPEAFSGLSARYMR